MAAWERTDVARYAAPREAEWPRSRALSRAALKVSSVCRLMVRVTRRPGLSCASRASLCTLGPEPRPVSPARAGSSGR